MDITDRMVEENYQKMKPEYKKLNLRLLEKIPEITEIFNAYVADAIFDGIETDGYAVFDGVVSPFTYKNINNKELVNRIFAFVEDMLSQEGSMEENVANVSFWENLVYSYDPREFFDFVKEGTKNYESMQYYVKEKLRQ